jgi:hypothetical protein
MQADPIVDVRIHNATLSYYEIAKLLHSNPEWMIQKVSLCVHL